MQGDDRRNDLLKLFDAPAQTLVVMDEVKFAGPRREVTMNPCAELYFLLLVVF